MKIAAIGSVVGSLVVASPIGIAQTSSGRTDTAIQVVLLGTASGPTFDARRIGIGTLVRAGQELLLFDAGRAVSTGMVRAGISPADVTKVFLTHLHSDHIVSVPELYLFPWSQGRSNPLQVWGPEGTRAMMDHLQEAFAFDIHARRDVDEKFSADGIKSIATDIKEGVVHEASGVKVTAAAGKGCKLWACPSYVGAPKGVCRRKICKHARSAHSRIDPRAPLPE